jgi:hypothetical protein
MSTSNCPIFDLDDDRLLHEIALHPLGQDRRGGRQSAILVAGPQAKQLLVLTLTNRLIVITLDCNFGSPSAIALTHDGTTLIAVTTRATSEPGM